MLMEVEVPVVTRETCTAAMSDFANITEGMICAGGVAGQDACQVRRIFRKIFSQIIKIMVKVGGQHPTEGSPLMC